MSGSDCESECSVYYDIELNEVDLTMCDITGHMNQPGASDCKTEKAENDNKELQLYENLEAAGGKDEKDVEEHSEHSSVSPGHDPVVDTFVDNQPPDLNIPQDRDADSAKAELKIILTKNYSAKRDGFQSKATGVDCVPVDKYGSYTEIVLAGINAPVILNEALEEISEDFQIQPAVITVGKSKIDCLEKIGVFTLLKAVVLDAYATKDAILVLESVKEEHIFENHTEFVRETLLSQSSFSHVIFLNPLVESFDCFLRIGAKVILSGFSDTDTYTLPAKVNACSITDETDDNAVRNSKFDNADNCTASRTIKKHEGLSRDDPAEAHAQSSNFAVVSLPAPAPVLKATSPPPVRKLEARTSSPVNETEIEMPIMQPPSAVLPLTPVSGRKVFSFDEQSLESVKQNHGPCNCILRAVHFVWDLIAQCGDCCFY